MANPFFELISKLAIRAPYLLIAAVFAVTLLLGISALSVSMLSDNMDFFPTDSPIRHNIEAHDRDFGTGSLLLVIVAPDVTEPEIFEMMVRLKDDFLNSDQVSGVSTPSDLLLAKYGKIPDKQVIEQEFLGTGAMPDKSSVSMRLHLKSYDKYKADSVAAELLKIIDFTEKPDGVEIKAIGDPVIGYQIGTSITESASIMFGVAMLLMVVLLYLFSSGAIRGRIMPLLPVTVAMISAIWTFGMMQIFEIPVTPMTSGFLPILIGMSIDYGVLIQSRYEEEIQSGKEAVDAIAIAVGSTGRGVFLALVTTVFGFSSLLFTWVPNLQYFGLTLTFGITSSYIISLLFLPPVLLLREKGGVAKKTDRAAAGKDNIGDTMGRLSRFTVDHSLPVFAVMLLVTAAGAYGYSNVSFLSDPMKYFPDTMQLNQDFKFLDIHFGRGDEVTVVVKTYDARDPDFLNDLLSLGNYVRDGEDKVRKTTSIATLLVDRYGSIPDDRAQVSAFIDSLPEKDNYIFGNSETALRFDTAMLFGAESGLTERRIRNAITFYDPSIDFYIVGSPSFKEGLTRGMVTGQNTMTVISFILVALSLLFFYRSLRQSLFPLIPIAITLAVTGGAMYALDIPHT
ncbi:MAG TPA: RND family transporter, partial [Candidatus Methanoperedenaceae archaeon]|nr:RND family transporter [Candidatus Methanoperedenaceae archaeon]